MDVNGNKDFQGWILLKEKIHNNGGKPRFIHEVIFGGMLPERI